MNGFEPNVNFEYYLHFICERMDIFWRRKTGMVGPYTQDETLSSKKFTNVYRALDRVSQYLISDVIYNYKGQVNDYSTEDIFYRIILFKHFNKIETWEYIVSKLGDITCDVPLKDIKEVLDQAVEEKMTIYNSAYMMTASFMRNPKILGNYGIEVGESKHSSYFKILRKDLFNNQKVLFGILGSKSLHELYTKLHGVNTIGEFLAMQYAIDLNYSPLFNFDENTFIIAGPGAQRGIERTFEINGKADYQKILLWVLENLDVCMEAFEFDPEYLPNRKPTLIDLQNCFCETDKYLRDRGIQTEGKEIEGKRVKNHFNHSQSFKKEKIEYFLPPKWKVDLQ